MSKPSKIVRVKSHTRKGKVVKSHSRKVTTADVHSHPRYMRAIQRLSEKYHEDLRGDGSFPTNHEAYHQLKELAKTVRKELHSQFNPPKPRARKPQTTKPRAYRYGMDPNKNRKGYYRIPGTDTWRKG